MEPMISKHGRSLASQTAVARYILSLLLAIVGLSPLGASANAAAITKAPTFKIIKMSPGLAPGLIFIAPKHERIPKGTTLGPVGPEILDNRGRVIWFLPIKNGQVPTDFRVQQYRGHSVLTWAQERNFGGPGKGKSLDYILDQNHHVVATVHAGNGFEADGHEFLLTPRGTALITIQNVVPEDLSSVGGRKRGKVIEGVIQEVDIATGRVVLEWHSLGHVDLRESYMALPKSAAIPWDYIHINAISLDTDGNLLLSSRHTSTIYKVNRRSGRLIWRLGGKKSDFVLGPGARFSFQHDIVEVAPNLIRIFDNQVNPKPLRPSRVIWLKLDPVAKTAALVRVINHPQKIQQSNTQGSAQELGNGDIFVGWGQTGRISEFAPSGKLLFDAVLPKLPKGYDTYRAYKFVWPVTFGSHESSY